MRQDWRVNDFDDEQPTAASGVVDEFEAAAVERFGRAVGERLRSVRTQKGLSLHAVEVESNKEFKASVLGAYERGERSISAPRLLRLADFYGVRAEVMMPQPEGVIALPGDTSRESISLDLVGLAALYSPMAEAIRRYVSAIQIRRGDYAGKVMTLRRDDITVLASVLGTTNAALIADLEAKGLVVKR
ncbi:MAG: helix-turn-helix domain-containing protein [Actinobacteria bacterium]|nr:helix-turn-helix domain-containing protein [Actinomycetota bacterium]MSX33077.1 helix-turn-helix domain-containing protein [Actinomycetota bacterium]